MVLFTKEYFPISVIKQTEGHTAVLFIKEISLLLSIYETKYELRLVLSFVQTKLSRINYSFNILEPSSAVTSGLKRETNNALDLSGSLMTDSDRELLTPMQDSLRCLTFLVAGISAEGVLVAVFFLYVTVLNPS
jgi:hypothetical protein